jgi:hypothetical protein
VGLDVVNVIDDEGVVEGTMPADRLIALRELDCVAYVRNVFTYIAGERDREQGAAGEESARPPRRRPGG